MHVEDEEAGRIGKSCFRSFQFLVCKCTQLDTSLHKVPNPVTPSSGSNLRILVVNSLIDIQMRKVPPKTAESREMVDLQGCQVLSKRSSAKQKSAIGGGKAFNSIEQLLLFRQDTGLACYRTVFNHPQLKRSYMMLVHMKPSTAWMLFNVCLLMWSLRTPDGVAAVRRSPPSPALALEAYRTFYARSHSQQPQYRHDVKVGTGTEAGNQTALHQEPPGASGNHWDIDKPSSPSVGNHGAHT
ncbi:hypothetical protein R1sor_010415 [Riccia sorocarpa]|uniref:Uncharacterized protein n=1 Tax=Riccia sorocarpa TaxID=122646 RepID=A0ABD3HZX3_9MARC